MRKASALEEKHTAKRVALYPPPAPLTSIRQRWIRAAKAKIVSAILTGNNSRPKVNWSISGDKKPV